MKRVEYTEYGGLDNLSIQEVPIPGVGANEILMEIKAFSINEIDWKVRNGDQKMITGSNFPRGMGCDLAGIVKDCGSEITEFITGQEVIGWLDFKHAGAYAEYAVLKPEQLTKKPANVSFEEGACLPMVGATTRQALLDEAKLHAGQSILINGCTGGLGHYAVQLAKQQGATVTGTCRQDHVALAEELGADDVVDYTQTDIRQYGKQYDVILDTSKHLPFSEAKPLLNHPGIYLDTQPGIPAFIGSFFNNLFSEKKHDVLGVSVRKADLIDLVQRASEGKLKTVIGKTYSFGEVISALREIENGQVHVPGKIVVIV